MNILSIMNNIIEHLHNGQRWLFVPTPSEADDFEIDVDGLHMYQNPPHSDMTLGSIDFPQGNWQIVSKLSDITEEQAREMVKGPYQSCYFDYRQDYYYWETAIESLQTKVESKGGDPHNNEYLVLKEG